MEISYGEFALILWGAVMTALYLKQREDFSAFKMLTVKTYLLVARRKAEIIETEDGIARSEEHTSELQSH